MYSERIFLLALALIFSGMLLQAQSSVAELEFNPVLVDSLLQEKLTDSAVLSASSASTVFDAGESTMMDVQSLKPRQEVASVYVVAVVLLLLVVLLKFFYSNFFQLGLLSLANEKIFLLHFRGKKFSQAPAIIMLMLMRLSVPALILQYGLYIYTDDKAVISVSCFLTIFALVAIFSLMRHVAEMIVQSMAGQSKIYVPYLVQHILITSWLWLPSAFLVLIIHVNHFPLSLQWFLGLVMIPVVLSSAFSLLRAAFIWGPVWRDNLLYFFAYFCTFKILPYLIAAKWLSENWKILT